MGKQITQKEAIKYIREEDFANTGLSQEGRKEIKDLHREIKKFLKNEKLVEEKVKAFELDLNNSNRDYYLDTLLFLKNEKMKENGYNLIDGYSKWSLSPTLWRFMEKIYEIKEGIINY